MATLTNTKIKDTYVGLLKTTDNQAIDAAGVTLVEDGAGNASALSVGRSGNGVTITGTITGNLSGNVTGDLTGTVLTAAQPNITSVGTLTGLNVNGGTDNILASFTSTDTAARIEFADNTTSGQVSVGAQGNDFVAFTNGQERLRIDSSGQVGIGTSSPSKMLDLSSNNTAGTALNTLRFTDTDTTCLNDQPQGAIEFYTSDTTDAGVASAIKGLTGSSGASLGRLVFETAGTEKMRIDSDGNVGIGESDPLAKTHIKSGNSGFSGSLNANYDDLAIEGSGNTGITILTPNNNNGGISFSDEDAEVQGSIAYRHSLDAMTFNTAGSEKVRIDSSGNVGIGESSPSSKIHVNSGTDNDVALFESTDQNATLTIQDSFAKTNLVHNVGQFEIQIDPDNVGGASALIVEIDGSEKIRVLNGGGITFNGDTAAANALDDYEEGSFTPEFADAATGGNVATISGGAYGRYTKIGNQVMIEISFNNIDTTGLTGGNDAHIRNLPFGGDSTSGAVYALGSVYLNNFTATANTIGIASSLNDAHDYVRLVQTIDGTIQDFATVSQFSSGVADIFTSFVYTTS